MQTTMKAGRHGEERPASFALDCFAEPVIGPAKPDPLARNDG
jgi:hypothetical protein